MFLENPEHAIMPKKSGIFISSTYMKATQMAVSVLPPNQEEPKNAPTDFKMPFLGTKSCSKNQGHLPAGDLPSHTAHVRYLSRDLCQLPRATEKPLVSPSVLQIPHSTTALLKCYLSGDISASLDWPQVLLPSPLGWGPPKHGQAVLYLMLNRATFP